MTTKRTLIPAFILAGAMISSVAAADVPPPGLQSCVNKTAGVACDMENTAGQPTGQIGVCTTTMQCGTRVPCGADSSTYPVCPDASIGPPGYVWEPYACLLCQAGDAGAADAATDSVAPTDSATGADSPVAAGGAAGAGGAVATGGAAGAGIGAGGTAGSAGTVALGGAAGTTAAGGSAGAPSEPPGDEGGGCSLGSANATKTFGPWLLSGGVAALLLLARRRRRD